MFSETSQIKSFFKNQTVFLTGGSGFLGKVLIEKLLRECEELGKIYVLMRSKKNKTPEQRFEELFNYAPLKAKNVNLLKKVHLINGDCQQPLLGLSDGDVEILTKETTCVIHAAANVKFDQSLKEATYSLRSTKDLLKLAKKMTSLKVFVYVSTAYSNCLNSHIREDFYEPPIQPENIIAVVNSLDDDTLQSITPQLLKKWPNTYIYSKAITEDLIRKAGDDLPITVIRPAIVASTISEPIPGWIDNFYGLIGIVTAASLGFIRSVHAKLDAPAYIVPIDLVANCLLAAAWKRNSSNNTTIYNFVGHNENILTWMEFMNSVEPHCWSAPSEKALFHIYFKLRENELWHKIFVFFSHTVHAYIVDGIRCCTRRPPMSTFFPILKMSNMAHFEAVKNYERVNKVLSSVSYFSTRRWTFDYDNVTELWSNMNETDRKLFFFDMEKTDWNQYGHDSVMGARLHLLKDTPDTIPQGQRKMMILRGVQYTVFTLLFVLLYMFVMFLWGIYM